MSNTNVKNHISELLLVITQESENMINVAFSAEKVIKDIMNYTSSELTAACHGYISSIYSALSDKTLEEPEFQDTDHANKFFDLELDQKMMATYGVHIKDLPCFAAGIDYQAINRTYTSVAAGVGTATVGGALLGALSGVVNIPVICIVTGTIIAGLTGFGVSYAKVIPDLNNARILAATKAFMSALEAELYHWVDEVTAYYDSQVDELKKSF